MKRLIALATILISGFVLVGSVPNVKASDVVLGPSCTFAPSDSSDTLYSGSSNVTIAESFTTTLDTITKVTLKAKSFNNFTGTILASIYKMPDATVPTNGTTTRTFSNMGSIAQDYEFTFPGLVDVDSSSNYHLVVWISGASTGTFYWLTTSGGSCYPGGHQYINTVQSYTNIDMGFAIYGYNPPVSDTPVQTTTNTTTNTGATPSTQTTASIAAPTSLTAANVAGATTPTVKLTWKKSTTSDITGYKIFRSTAAKTGFAEIGTVAKTISEYSDATGLASTQYYYFVRAYKGTAESASSSTVNVTTEAAAVATTETVVPTTPAAAVETAATVESKNLDWLLIALIALLAALAGTITFFELKAKKNGGNVPNKFLYPLVGLVVVTAGLITWRIISNNTGTDSKTETPTTSAVVTPKHADWQLYTSSKYGFKLYHPVDYTVAEGATGTIKLTKAGVEMADLYVYSAEGDTGGMMKSSVALFTDATKGYMTGGAEVTTTAAGQTATRVSGTFGKNAGISQTHAGVTGSMACFIKNDNLFVLDSYDNGDTAAQTIFADMLADMSF